MRLKTIVVTLLCCGIVLAGDEQVVVLQNGSVFQGLVEQQGSQVVISAGRSEIRLPKSDVLMVTADLATAYQRQAKNISRVNTEGRVQLIQWCLRHNLRAEAAQELAVLRSLSPRHPQISLLSDRLSRSGADRGSTELPARQALPRDRRYAQDSQSKLSKSTLSTFARSIQPLLVNRCAQASCHGKAATSSYHLSLSRWAGSRGVSETNLGATLRRIGPHPPEQTLLWMSAKAAHGPLDEPPLSAAEIERFRAWIEAVARELHDQETSKSRPAVETASAEVADDTPDPFDPARFNALNNPTASPID